MGAGPLSVGSRAVGADVLRPPKRGVRAWVAQQVRNRLGVGFAVLRKVRPIARFGGMYVVTRYDDVREVFLADEDFPVPYQPKLDVIMGGEPFFLGMGNTEQYRRDTATMRLAVKREDLPARLGPETLALAEAIVVRAGGNIEVVDALARTVTFEVLCRYFGVPSPPDADLRIWATRLFEFQFARFDF